MKKMIFAALAAVAMISAAALPAAAQSQTPPTAQEGTSADMPWYVTINYNGFDFEIPAGSIVEKGATVLVKYPDGSFGMSMINEETPGAVQQVAFELCRRMVKQLDIKDAHVDKRTIGGVEGAIAKGTIEGRQVTVIILPANGQATTTVIMATPNRQNWADHLVESIRKS